MDRVDQLIAQFDSLRIDGIILHDMAAVRYFSGFTGSHARLIISGKRRVLFTDARYTEQAESESTGWEIVTCGIDRFGDLIRAIRESGVSRPGFEADILSVEEFSRLEAGLEQLELVPTSGLCTALRSVKDAGEIELIRKALDIAENALAELLTEIRPGMSEKEIAVRLDFLMYRHGSEAAAFDTIVAGGSNTSRPHHSPGRYEIRPNDTLLFDFGAQVEGYKSDITRMVYLDGEPEAFRVIREATENALKTVEAELKPGMTGQDADTLARDVFRDCALEQYTLRGLGHGVGLAIHEWPRLTIDSTMVLKPGMVCTLEPGVYLPGKAGVRLENLARITATGAEIFNKSPLTHTIATV